MDIEFSFRHKLNDVEAKKRVKKLIAEQSKIYQDYVKCFESILQADGSWVLKCKVLGFSLSGKIEFRPGEVRAIGDLPMLLKVFLKKVREKVEKEINALLE
ncbi:MAG: polyhydroxyalkanoic acid system family protein [Patescibacteria group bacterium]